MMKSRRMRQNGRGCIFSDIRLKGVNRLYTIGADSGGNSVTFQGNGKKRLPFLLFAYTM